MRTEAGLIPRTQDSKHGSFAVALIGNGNDNPPIWNFNLDSPFIPSSQAHIKPPNTFCALCLGEYHQDEMVIVYGCMHNFHQNCAHLWSADRGWCSVCQREVKYQGQAYTYSYPAQGTPIKGFNVVSPVSATTQQQLATPNLFVVTPYVSRGHDYSERTNAPMP
ncbi:hypothetical protein EV182_005288 [Spiromyces aspiralis]|uniref:Uncharacterized protein n=1 Tax=Spiromyces aspiralis TaxID=68401 RepID=A0ACC1HBP2_9FUNG|nr:hypothetical protein EV182_005288 [Spiromyces aspiralis]